MAGIEGVFGVMELFFFLSLVPFGVTGLAWLKFKDIKIVWVVYAILKYVSAIITVRAVTKVSKQWNSTFKKSEVITALYHRRRVMVVQCIGISAPR